MTESPISPVVDELWERRSELSPADEDARAQVKAPRTLSVLVPTVSLAS